MQEQTYNKMAPDVRDQIARDFGTPDNPEGVNILEKDPHQHGVPEGYVRLNNGEYNHGQIVKLSTFEKMVRQGRVKPVE